MLSSDHNPLDQRRWVKDQIGDRRGKGHFRQNHRAKAKNYERPRSLQETSSLTQLSLRKQGESTRCKPRKRGKTLGSRLSYLGVTGSHQNFSM